MHIYTHQSFLLETLPQLVISCRPRRPGRNCHIFWLFTRRSIDMLQF